MSLQNDIKEFTNDYSELLDLIYKAEFALVDLYPEEDVNKIKALMKKMYDKSIDLIIEKELGRKDDVNEIKIPSFMLDNKRSS